MPIPTFTGLRPKPQFEDVVHKLNELADELTNLMLNLDDANFDSITANVIVAGTITGDKIAADTITADKMDVSELSAITANLGTITAGSITTDTTIDVGTDVTIGNNLNLGLTDYTGSKKISWSSDTGTKAEIRVITGDMGITTAGFITLTIGSSQGLVVNKKVTAPNFHATSGIDIGGVPVALSSAVSGTWYAAPTSGGSPTVALTFSNGVLVSAV